MSSVHPASLCGKSPCPRLCQRVCHCPAGLARSHELAGMYRNRREKSKPRASLLFLFPRERWHEVEFISQSRHNFGVLNQPQHKKPSRLLPTHNYRQQSVPYTRQFKPFTSIIFTTIILLIMGLVVFFGVLANDGDFCPGYEPPPIYHQEWR